MLTRKKTKRGLVCTFFEWCMHMQMVAEMYSSIFHVHRRKVEVIREAPFLISCLDR